jgi:hypothetical protein
MMRQDHWFDDLVRNLALPKVSRRSAFRGALAGLIASANRFSFGVDLAAAQAPPLVVAAGPCAARQDGQTLLLEFKTQRDFQGKALVFKQTIIQALPRGGYTVARIAITLDDVLLLQIHTSRSIQNRIPLFQVNGQFGDPSKETKAYALSSRDGKVLQGTVDGRLIYPFPIGGDPKALEFADGQPAPDLPIDQATQVAIEI